MRLLSLTIDGFKSFAHKTTIKFAKGMNGIVGPNGSGKSNIIEAIRWVMGEQSARHLRGDKMADVIFNGSAAHAPLNRAQVSITFDNSDHYLASDFTELTITRKLFRNGDSEYLINGQQVRLKDIVDLFIDSGLGRESFSIISQGRIEAVFNGKPADRRAIIETVAGVAKYRKNKESAEKRLGTTMDNLNRVNDIIHELSGELAPLEEQSALAKDYLEQKDQFDRFDQTRIVRSHDRQHAQLTALQDKLQQSKKLADQYQRQAQTGEEKVSQLKQRRATLLKQKDAAQQNILQQTKLIADYHNQQSVSTVKQQQQRQEAARLKQSLAENHQQQEAVKDQLTDLASAVKKHKAAVAEHQAQLAAVQHQTAAAQQEELRKKLAELRSQQVDLLQQQTTLHNQATYLQQNHQHSINQQKRSSADLAEREAKKEQLDQQLKSSQQSADRYRQRVTADRESLAQTNRQLTQVDQQYQQAQRQWYQLLGDAHSTESRIKSFQSMEESYTGYYRGVQAVLQHRQLFVGLAGAVSELIDVPAKITLAVETVLGGQLQQLVVDRQTTGKKIIQYLVRHRSGRVTILPLDSLQRRHPLTIWPALSQLPGYVGRASDLVHYDSRYQPVVDHLLANTAIADNLDHATAIARAGRHRVRVVTLDGQLINASGSMTGGANRHQLHGLLSQKQTGRELTALLDKQRAQASKLEKTVAKLQQSRKRGQEKLVQQQGKLHAQEQALQDVQATVSRYQDQLNELDRQISALHYQNDQQDSRHHSYQDQLAANKDGQQKVDTQLAAVMEQTQQTNRRLKELQTNADSQDAHFHSLNQWLAVAGERSQQYARQDKELRSRLAGIKQAAKGLADRLNRINQRLHAQNSDGKDTAAALAAAQTGLTDSQKELAGLNDRIGQLDQQLSVAEKGQERQQDLQRAALNSVSDLNSKKIRCEGQLNQLLDRLSEHYSMTIEEARGKIDQQISDQDLATRLKLLKRGIDELGEVNVSAIGEYDRVKERYDFLKGQQDDLLASRDQLRQTMDEMDGEVKQRFITTFNRVSKAFDETFRQIFAGGRAKLELTDPHDLLTTGVDIMAQPPGKKNQHMNLLSGGERALTAITLLFAILKVRPVPFAILDEPEAALDEVNVQRFANYLKRFGTSGPQFIVITHRKGTMMGANVLYGVTMQESGISKMVSVDVVKALGEGQEEKEG